MNTQYGCICQSFKKLSFWSCYFCFLHSLTWRCLSRLAKCGANTRPRPRCPRCPCPSNRHSSCLHRTTWSSLSTPCPLLCPCSLPSPTWTRRWISQKWRCRIFTGSHHTAWLRTGAAWQTGWENTSLESFAPNRRTRPECHLMRFADTWSIKYFCFVLLKIINSVILHTVPDSSRILQFRKLDLFLILNLG